MKEKPVEKKKKLLIRVVPTPEPVLKLMGTRRNVTVNVEQRPRSPARNIGVVRKPVARPQFRHRTPGELRRLLLSGGVGLAVRGPGPNIPNRTARLQKILLW